MFMDISLMDHKVQLVIRLFLFLDTWNVTTLLCTIRPSITQLPNLLDPLPLLSLRSLLPLLPNDHDIRTLTMEQKSLLYNSLCISQLQANPLREQKISKFIRVLVL
jgi:hypothetical protein